MGPIKWPPHNGEIAKNDLTLHKGSSSTPPQCILQRWGVEWWCSAGEMGCSFCRDVLPFRKVLQGLGGPTGRVALKMQEVSSCGLSEANWNKGKILLSWCITKIQWGSCYTSDVYSRKGAGHLSLAEVKWGRAEVGLGLEEGSHVWREGRGFPIGEEC